MEKRDFAEARKILEYLGFVEQLDQKLMLATSFGDKIASIHFTQTLGQDMCNFDVSLRQTGSQIRFSHYTALLRKSVLIDSQNKGIEKRMSAIDWNMIASARSFSHLQVPVEILRDVHELLEEVESLPEQSILKYKYWRGTPLELMIPCIGELKSRYELNQCFYISDASSAIKADEAIRFLLNRWTEREMQQRRRVVTQNQKGERQTSGKRSGRKRIAKKA